MAAAKTLILGGSGFVGLNIAEALLARGRPVRLFDRTEPPHEAKEAFGRLPGACETVVGDVTDPGSLDAAVLADIDAIVLGATITADAERDRREPSRVLQVNVLGQIPVLERARTAGIRRIVNLSSGAAYGRTGMRLKLLEETSEADPEGLYALSKFASERVVARMGSLWGLDTVSVRLSGVFGPWERATGVRDTLSPHHQVVSIAKAGGTALLDRPALRDWIYAPDVTEAVIGLIDASSLQHSLYNVSSPTVLVGARLVAALENAPSRFRLPARGRRRTAECRSLRNARPRRDGDGTPARRDGLDGALRACRIRLALCRLARTHRSRRGPVTLDGRVVVVTGAASGIGAAVAVLFAREGARLALVDRDAAGLDTTATAVASTGEAPLLLAGDAGDPESSEAGARTILERWGRIHTLVAAAGISTGGTVLTTEPAAWDAVFRTHVGGTWLWSRAVIPAMRDQGGGTIVTVASQLALAGGRGNSAYIAAKGAILSLTRTMALDFADDGIRVNAVAPGAIDTPMLRRSFGRRPDPLAAEAASRDRHALKRFGVASEVAAAVLFLAGPQSSFVTGITLPVDGGWLAA